ncbi:MAG: hypothetical protein KF706_12000 [Chitinophagales bacterium]|nr:hypothetical protein [Chitinophagales bacterium]
MNNVRISSFASFKNGTLKVNGNVLLESAMETFFLTYYEVMKLNYPKFFKMDNLSKLAFVTCDKLFEQDAAEEVISAFEKGLIFSTADGCLDTDEKYFQSTESIPSPALFVYTLPNIAAGELSIRHGLKGEMATFIFEEFNPEFQTKYVQSLFEEKRVSICISGWANFYGESTEAFFYLVRKSENGIIHSTENIQKLLDKSWKN